MSAQLKPSRAAASQTQLTVERIAARLGVPIAYRPEFAQLGGGGNAGVLLSQLWYWHDKGALPDGWIWKSAREWQEETGLTRREQQTAIKRLVERKLVETRQPSRRAPMQYRLNVAELLAQLEQLSPPRPRVVAATADAPEETTSVADSCHSVCTFGASGDAPIRHTSETTLPEITSSENTHTLPRDDARARGAPAARVCVSLSKFSAQARTGHMQHGRDYTGKPLGFGWLRESAEGLFDEALSACRECELARVVPLVVEAENAGGTAGVLVSDAEIAELAEAVQAVCEVQGRRAVDVIAELLPDVRDRVAAQFGSHEARADVASAARAP